MSAINRYTTPTVAEYSPFSMEELAFAPSFLRQRHDELNAAVQALHEQNNQNNVHKDFDNIANQLIDPITQELTGLSSDLSQKGINESRGVDRLMQLNAKQKELFSPKGAIGQLQGRTQQYQEGLTKMDEFFKDNPELARFKQSQANIGKATVNPETGKLELGDMSLPNYVRHIADEDIMKQLNEAVKGLSASDLGASGIILRSKLGEFTDLFNEDMVSGVTPQRIKTLLDSLMGPEIKASVSQYGEMMGYTSEESLDMLNNRIVGMANSSATEKRDRRYFQVLDQRAVKALNEEIPAMSFITPGGAFEGPLSNIFGDIKINEKDNPFLGEKGDRTYWEKLGYNVLPTEEGFGVYTKGGRGFPSVPVYSHNEAEFENYNERTQQFLDYKNSIPELRDLSNKEAKTRIDKYSKEYQTQYQHTINPGDNRVLKQLNESILGSGGDISNRRVLGQKGGSGDFQEVMKQLGYNDYEEFEQSKPQIHGYRLIAGQGVYYEAKVKDKKNKNITSSIFIQADSEVENAFKKSIAINAAIIEGKIVDTPYIDYEYDKSTGQPIEIYTTVINNPGTNNKPFVVESFEPITQQDVIGLTPNQILAKYGKTEIRIKDISEIMKEESKAADKHFNKQFK